MLANKSPTMTSCHMDPIPSVDPPAGALFWTSKIYYDGSSWVQNKQGKELELRPTTFEDHRLEFLEREDGSDPIFTGVKSGQYDVKCWKKFGTHVGIEGDQTIFLKTPYIHDVVVYRHRERLPSFSLSWKPIAFLLNKHLLMIRVTDSLCLVVINDKKAITEKRADDQVATSSSGEKRNFKTVIHSVDYNGGFICTHPATDQVFAFGSYAVSELKEVENCKVVPDICEGSMFGNWGYYIYYYSWGAAFIPKGVEITKGTNIGEGGVSSLFSKLTGGGNRDIYDSNKKIKKRNTIALLYIPPHLFIYVNLECLSLQQPMSLEYKKDFLIDCKKPTSTDVEIYLNIQGQLVCYNFSYDLRVNKDSSVYAPISAKSSTDNYNSKQISDYINNEKDDVYACCAFKCNIDKQLYKEKQQQQFIFSKTKTQKILCKEGSPINPNEHFLDQKLVGIYDAEISMHYTHPSVRHLTQAFLRMAVPVEKDKE